MAQRQQKTFHLKVANITPPQDKNFTTLVNEAWQNCTTAKELTYRINQDSDQYKVLNDLTDMDIVKKGTIISCPLFAYTLNANQNAMEISSDAKSYPVTVYAPQRDKEKRLEFAKGLVWMCATGNYVAFMANKMISHNNLEEYFSWLISKFLPKNASVTFIDPEKPSLNTYNMTNATKIILSPEINLEQASSKVTTSEKKHIYNLPPVKHDMVKNLLAACGASMPDLSTDNVNSYKQLDISIILRVIRRNDYANSATAIRKIAEVFRDVKNPPVKIEFADGRKLDIRELRISNLMPVACTDGIPDSSETQQVLYKWLMEQITLLKNPKRRI